jgi:hypothetical protein
VILHDWPQSRPRLAGTYNTTDKIRNYGCEISQGIIATDLMLSQVNVIHINQGNGIPVLIVIECNSDLIKKQLDIESRRLFVQFIVHYDLWRIFSEQVRRLTVKILTLPSPETGLRIN